MEEYGSLPYQIYIPKELEEFEWKDLVNPTFWSTKTSLAHARKEIKNVN